MENIELHSFESRKKLNYSQQSSLCDQTPSAGLAPADMVYQLTSQLAYHQASYAVGPCATPMPYNVAPAAGYEHHPSIELTPMSSRHCNQHMSMPSTPVQVYDSATPSLLTSAYHPGQSYTTGHAMISPQSNFIHQGAAFTQMHTQHNQQLIPFSPTTPTENCGLTSPFTSPHLGSMAPSTCTAFSQSTLLQSTGISREPSPGAMEALSLTSPPLASCGAVNTFPDGHPLSINPSSEYLVAMVPYTHSNTNTEISTFDPNTVHQIPHPSSGHHKTQSYGGGEYFTRCVGDQFDTRASFSGVPPWQTTEAMYSPTTIPPRHSLSLSHPPPSIAVACSAPLDQFPYDPMSYPYNASMGQLPPSTAGISQLGQSLANDSATTLCDNEYPMSGYHAKVSSKSNPTPLCFYLNGNVASEPSTPIMAPKEIPMQELASRKLNSNRVESSAPAVAPEEIPMQELNSRKLNSNCVQSSAPAVARKKSSRYMCREMGCGKTFTRGYNQRSHEQTHFKGRPFQCMICCNRFAREHDMRRHLKLHFDIRPHVCPNCHHRFARVDALTRHLKVYYGHNKCNTALTIANSPRAMPMLEIPEPKQHKLVANSLERIAKNKALTEETSSGTTTSPSKGGSNAGGDPLGVCGEQ